MTASDYKQEDGPPYRMESSAGVVKDVGGIRRVELPLPFPPGCINVYLVPQEGGWILVDCGMNLPDSLPAYESAGIPWSDIRQTLLTHAHPDHSGLAARIRELSGAPVRMHHREEGALKSLREPEHWLGWQDEILRQAGTPAAMRVRFEDASLGLRGLFPNRVADSYIDDGEVIPTRLGPMRAMLAPGHSPGHLCFYFPEAKILLAGDNFSSLGRRTWNGTPRAALWPSSGLRWRIWRGSMWSAFFHRMGGLSAITPPASSSYWRIVAGWKRKFVSCRTAAWSRPIIWRGLFGNGR